MRSSFTIKINSCYVGIFSSSSVKGQIISVPLYHQRLSSFVNAKILLPYTRFGQLCCFNISSRLSQEKKLILMVCPNFFIIYSAACFSWLLESRNMLTHHQCHLTIIKVHNIFLQWTLSAEMDGVSICFVRLENVKSSRMCGSRKARVSLVRLLCLDEALAWRHGIKGLLEIQMFLFARRSRSAMRYRNSPMAGRGIRIG